MWTGDCYGDVYGWRDEEGEERCEGEEGKGETGIVERDESVVRLHWDVPRGGRGRHVCNVGPRMKGVGGFVYSIAMDKRMR